MGVASSPGPHRPHPTRRDGRPPESADGTALDLIALVAAVEPGEHDGDPAALSPEDRRILGSCRKPVTVAEVASVTALPVNVVRIRLADLIRRGRVTLQPQPPVGGQPRPGLLNEVLDGLRTLLPAARPTRGGTFAATWSGAADAGLSSPASQGGGRLSRRRPA